jgi:hypothetical protein
MSGSVAILCVLWLWPWDRLAIIPTDAKTSVYMRRMQNITVVESYNPNVIHISPVREAGGSRLTLRGKRPGIAWIWLNCERPQKACELWVIIVLPTPVNGGKGKVLSPFSLRRLSTAESQR